MKAKLPARKDRFVIIMAGGRGERFWPVSREKTPKQLIRLLGRQSFLQMAVDRVRGLVPTENVLIITNQAQAAEVRRQLPALPAANVIAEPMGRDTCAAVALGAAVVGARSPKGVMAVLPADHLIPDAKAFRQVLSDTLATAASEEVIVTIGIQPNEPATGYGYIKAGKPAPGLSLTTPVRKAEAFVEKPNLATARKYLKSGRYLWNAGMFIWSYETISKALSTHVPELWSVALGWQQVARRASSLRQALERDYPGLKKVSVDYAIMEKVTNVLVADGAFAWDDLGAWPALGRHLQKDGSDNCAVGNLVQVDSTGNILFDGRSRPGGLVGLVGLERCIVVLTDDATLVASLDKDQEIKKLVAGLAENQRWSKLR